MYPNRENKQEERNLQIGTHICTQISKGRKQMEGKKKREQNIGRSP